MNELNKILLASSMALIISFVGLFVFLQAYDFTEITAFSEEFSNTGLPEKRIFLMGSSHVMPLNQTFIQNYLTENGFNNFKVYDMGKPADLPSERIKFLEQIIEAEPTLIVYALSPTTVGYETYKRGIWKTCTSYEPFESNNEDSNFESGSNLKSLTFIPNQVNVLPSIQDVIAYYDIGSSTNNYLPKNFDSPKITVNKILISAFEQETKLEREKISESENSSLPDERLFGGDNNNPREITDISLLKMKQNHIFLCQKEMELQLSNLNEMVTRFSEANINVITFQPPYSQVYLDNMGENHLNYYHFLVNNFVEDNDLPLLRLTDKYVELNIWRDTNHVAKNPKVTIYSEDIAKFIMQELESLN